MKTLEPKYVTSYGNADWYGQPEFFEESYAITTATVSQLRKLNIPTIKALTGYDNSYKKYYTPILCNMISKEDEAIVNSYLEETKEKAAKKLDRKLEIINSFKIVEYKKDNKNDLKLFPDEYSFYCPFCEAEHIKSDYLSKAFADDTKVQWLANMVTHYRHDHTDWDNIWPNTEKWQYEIRKEAINNKIKIEILKYAKDFLIERGITAQHFTRLAGHLNYDTQLKLIKQLPMQSV
jgi:hypothetical protein